MFLEATKKKRKKKKKKELVSVCHSTEYPVGARALFVRVPERHIHSASLKVIVDSGASVDVRGWDAEADCSLTRNDGVITIVIEFQKHIHF